MIQFLLSLFSLFVFLEIRSYSSDATRSRNLVYKTVRKLIYFVYFIAVGRSTIIFGTVRAKSNQLTWPLVGTNLALIIVNRENQEEVHQIRLDIRHNSFPFNFTTERIHEIKNDGMYHLLLLIFGNPHRLLWEAAFFEVQIKINIVNYIIFLVTDVCK